MAYPGYGGYGGPPPGVPVQGMSMPGGPMGGPMGNPMGGAGPAGFPGYGAYPGNFAPPPVSDPMWSYFRAIAGQDGEIDSEELQRCLTQTGVSGTYTPFSLETCRIMIAMLDKWVGRNLCDSLSLQVDMTGKMGFNEFKELFAALNGWKQNFMMFDQDRSGTVEPHEMAQAVSSMGYRISPNTLNGIIKRYSKAGRIAFDDYVACCVKLRSLTDAFRRRDAMQQGAVSFQYDDFLQCTMTI